MCIRDSSKTIEFRRGKGTVDSVSIKSILDFCCDAAVVVTRYFGGTLLGTGGLVRAYGAAVKAGLEASQTATMRYGSRIRIGTDYSDIGRIQYLLGQKGYPQENAEYTAVSYTHLFQRQRCSP